MLRAVLFMLMFSSNVHAISQNSIPDRFSPAELSKVERGEILVKSISVTKNGYKMGTKAFLPFLPEQFLEVMQDYERYPEFMQVSGSSGSIELEDKILSGRIIDSEIDQNTRLGELVYELEVFVKLSFIGFSIQEYQFIGQFSAEYKLDDDGTIIVKSNLINPTTDISEKLKSLKHYWEIFPASQGIYLYYEHSVEFAKPLTEPEWYDFVKPSLDEQKRIIRETISQKVKKVVENFRDELSKR